MKLNKTSKKALSTALTAVLALSTILSSFAIRIPTALAAVNVAWGTDGTAFASNPGTEQALPQGYQNTFWYNPLSRYSGFTFVGWRDARDSMLHVQKLDADGVGQWGSAGVSIDGTTFSVFNIITRADGAGGVYVIWEQGSNINVIRLDSDGSVHSGWATTGTQASNNNYFDTQGAVLDGSGGIIVIYDVSGSNVKGTRILPNGTTDWFDQLIVDASNYCNIDVGHAVSDGTGGVFIGWWGYSCDDFIHHYYLLRLDDTGSVSAGWNAAGVQNDAYANSLDSSRGLDLVADGSGGAFITWQRPDPITGHAGADVRIQHYDASANELWTAGGVYVVQDNGNEQDQPHVVTDGSGEAVVSFRVNEDHINAMRLNSSGATQWTSGGVTILTSTQGMEGVPVTDGSGGLIVTYKDTGGLFVQRWSSSATKLWGASGTLASSIIGGSQPFTRILSNDANGVVMVFESNDSPTQVIAQQVCEDTCPTSGGGGSNTPTTSNVITMGRLKAGETSQVDIAFDLSDALSTTLTVTFPVGFHILQAATAGSCAGGGTISNFGFDDSTRTLTADKSSCSGAVSMTGAMVINPSTPGQYHISWVNDDPGGGDVYIIDSDQVTVSADVTSSISFDIDTAQTDTDTSAPYSVSLGTITVSDGRVSGTTDAINFIWLDLDTNASTGAVVTVSSTNSALKSLAAPGDAIPSATAAMSNGTANYGICVVSNTAGSGTLNKVAPYASTCAGNSETNSVGGVTVSPQVILNTSSAPIATGRAQIAVNAAVSNTTPSHADYADTLKFIATGTF